LNVVILYEVPEYLSAISLE